MISETRMLWGSYQRAKDFGYDPEIHESYRKHYFVAGLGERLQSFDTNLISPGVRAAMDEVGLQEGPCVLILGPFGVGKTTAAAVMLMEAIDKGANGLFISHQALNSLKTGDSYLGITWSDLCATDVLVIDELRVGRTEAQVNFFEETLETILRTREALSKATILTSNELADDLVEKYPRLSETGLLDTIRVILINGENKRGAQNGR